MEKKKAKSFFEDGVAIGVHSEEGPEGCLIEMVGTPLDAIYCVSGILSAISKTSGIKLEEMFPVITKIVNDEFDNMELEAREIGKEGHKS